MGFIAAFMAAHPDLIDPINDYKTLRLQPDGHPVHRQRLRGRSPRKMPTTSTGRLHGRPRLEPHRARPSPPRAAGRPTTIRPSGATGAKARIMSDDVVLKISNVSKAFGAIQALRGVDFELRRGEVHAHRRRERRRQIDADEHHRRHPAARQRRDRARTASRSRSPRRRAAQELGIGFVHQEIALCPDATVAENIFMAEINASREWFDGLRGAARARPRGAGAAEPDRSGARWWGRCRSPASSSSRSPRR